jgi:hypothetical protein
MTADPGAERRARCRATVSTTHADAATVAAALEPDNTDEMRTRVEDVRVVTTVGRDSPGGLRSTVDDYVVNLGVADRIADEHTADTSDTS